jgi:hypothetical protein
VFSSENSTRLNSGGSSIGDQDTQQQYAAMYGELMPAAGNLVPALASHNLPALRYMYLCQAGCGLCNTLLQHMSDLHHVSATRVESAMAHQGC